MDHSPWVSSLHQSVAIGTSMQTYTITWTHAEATTTYKVGLFLGAQGANDVWADDVILTEQ